MRLLIVALASALAVFSLTTQASASTGPEAAMLAPSELAVASSDTLGGGEDLEVLAAPPADFSSLMGTQCVPYTCEAWGRSRTQIKMCGVVTDGCGGTLHCGYCNPGERCRSGICVGTGPIDLP